MERMNMQKGKFCTGDLVVNISPIKLVVLEYVSRPGEFRRALLDSVPDSATAYVLGKRALRNIGGPYKLVVQPILYAKIMNEGKQNGQ